MRFLLSLVLLVSHGVGLCAHNTKDSTLNARFSLSAFYVSMNVDNLNSHIEKLGYASVKSQNTFLPLFNFFLSRNNWYCSLMFDIDGLFLNKNDKDSYHEIRTDTSRLGSAFDVDYVYDFAVGYSFPLYENKLSLRTGIGWAAYVLRVRLGEEQFNLGREVTLRSSTRPSMAIGGVVGLDYAFRLPSLIFEEKHDSVIGIDIGYRGLDIPIYDNWRSTDYYTLPVEHLGINDASIRGFYVGISLGTNF